MRSFVLLIALILIWLLWSGLYTPLLISLGVASCLLVVWLVRRFESIDHESVPVHLGLPVLTYWAWLLKEIVVSSIQVSKIILSPKLNIQPQVIEVESRALSVVGQVIFGNSITLTPGTMTTSISHTGKVTVHALTQDGAEGVLQGPMNQKVALLDRSEQHA
jgi:multicomponent Na+:H+ antiporter subunit E